MFCHYLNKTIVVTNLRKIVLGRKIEQDLEESTHLHNKGKAFFPDFPLAVESRVNSWQLWDSFPMHGMTVLKVTPKCLIFGCLCPKAAETTFVFHSEGMYMRCEGGWWEVSVTCSGCPQSREGDEGFCSWKSALTIMLGQFSYMLFASLKYIKSCHVKLIPLALF